MSEQAAPLGTVGVVRLVAGREIRERLRAKSFYILTGVLIAAILAIGVINRVASDDGPGAIEVGIAGSVPADVETVVAQTAERFERGASVTTFDDAAAARAAVEAGEVDVAVVGADHEMVFAEEVDDEILTVVQQAWASTEIQQSLLEEGLSPEQITGALATAPLQTVTLDGDAGNTGVGGVTGFLAAILLFIALQTFGGYVLTGVVEEKSTAVIELLLVRARADQLLAGKVIGIGVTALLQFSLAVAAGVVSLAISGADVPGVVWSALPMTIVWFVGGYALYSTLFALAGSLVSRQEDAQAASAPIITVLLGAYALVFVFGADPDSTASTIMSLLPPTAPLLMPMRMAAGAASVVEVIAALVLLAVAVLAAWKFTGKVYEQVVLRRGTRISWRDAATVVRPRGASVP